ncbi:MAG: ParB/RepB/Spo0J family partition protein [Burkholderiales bacterium]|jgi:ParB family chromosome partitioning protein|nr:ParB/RepB/Spo0J family partition protein [Burkholderiales bacterium]
MVKPKGLGRGLDALLGGDTAPSRSSSADAVTTLPIAALQPGKYQPRSRMDQGALNALAASIKAQGIMQPILVRPVGGGNHEIIAGERRWRAARIAGLSSVPVLVRDVPDQQALAVALIENIQREDLNALEEATGIERLINEFALTHQAVADAIGKSRAAVTNLLRLLELAPPVKTLLGAGRIEMGHARALLALPAVRQVELANEAAAKGLSVREVEQRVAALLTTRSGTRSRPAADRDVLRLQESLAEKLGTRVLIKTKRKGKGSLVIDYGSLDQLDGLISRLTGEKR